MAKSSTTSFIIIQLLHIALSSSIDPHFGFKSDSSTEALTYIVSVIYDSKTICDGGIIENQAVLTSAECCEQIKELGKAKVKYDTTEKDIAKVNSHPIHALHKNESSWTHDICVLLLKDDIVTQVLTPKKIEVESNAAKPEVKTQCTITTTQGEIKTLNVTIDESCTQMEGFNVTNGMFCLKSEEDLAANQLQSLIICDEKLAGLLLGVEDGKKFAAATRVSQHVEWIKEHSKENEGDGAPRNSMTAFLISSLIPLALSQIIR